jgi:hypothetical protein
MGYEEETIAEDVGARMARQAIIYRPEPPDITIVLWEPVLHHQIGSRLVMREQLARAVELSKRPKLLIHVLPCGANAGLGGAINLAAAADVPELLLSDAFVAGEVAADPVRVRKASATFNSVRGDALNRVDSRAKLVEALETWSD